MKTSLRKSINLILSCLVILTMIFPNLKVTPVSAQTKSPNGIQREYNAETGKVTMISGKDHQPLSVLGPDASSLSSEEKSLALVDHFATEFGLANPSSELTLSKINETDNGHVVSKYQQVYKGIPVMAGELIVNAGELGELYSMNGEVSPRLSLDTKPVLSIESAMNEAQQGMVKWYGGEAGDYTSTQPALWIFDERLLKPSMRPVNLVWRMDLTSTDESAPIRELVLVDAKTGNISLHFNQVDTAWGKQKDEPVSSNETSPTSTPLPPVTETSTPEPVDVVPMPIENTTTNDSPVVALSGTPWYVSTTGSDSNLCSTPLSPCLTIQQAITNSSADDTINIAVGTYTSSSTRVVDITKNIMLSGGWNDEFSSQTGYSTIDGGNIRTGVYINSSVAAVNITRLIIQNSNSNGLQMGGGTNVEISQSIVQLNRLGIFKLGGTLNVSSLALVRNNSYGLMNSSGNASFVNSTFSGNKESAIYNINGNINIQFSTITDNSSYAIYSASSGAQIEIGNSILAGNNFRDCFIANFTSDGYNIFGSPNVCYIAVPTKASDKVGINPQLNILMPGGFHIPLSGSPAIDAGNPAACPAMDQRGVARPQGASCDIGAVETAIPGEATSLWILSGNDQHGQLSFAFQQPLKIMVMDDHGSPVPAVPVTFTAPESGPSGAFADTGTNTTTATTDSSGITASSIFTANAQSGAYIVSASASGIAPINFTLENGKTLYVATTGNDSNSCLSGLLPCATINGALSKASVGGDTIEVSAGLYQGNAALVNVTKSIMILGGWDSGFNSQIGYSILDGTGSTPALQLIQITQSTIIERFVLKNAGGGIVISNSSTPPIPLMFTLRQSSITGIARSNGTGAVAIKNGGTLLLENSTISNNKGIGIYNSGTVVIKNSTITKNSSANWGQFVGGGIYSVGAPVSIQNSILIDNYGYGETSQDCGGSVTSNGHNIIGTTTYCGITPLANDQVGIDPKFGPLLPNGYFPLFSNSPAIDSGDPAACAATDQRGVSRPQGNACDIGSYEYAIPGNVTSLAIVEGNDQRTAPNYVFHLPLSIAPLDDQDNLVPNVLVNFSAPGSGASANFSDTGNNSTLIMSNSNGLAIASTLTANGQSGNYKVTASTDGVTAVDFSLQNSGLYVATTGDDANSCTAPDSPCLTINGAINKAITDDVILVASGTYTGTEGGVVHIDKNIILTGGWNSIFTMQNGESIIDGQGVHPGIYITYYLSSIIDRFTIQNGYNIRGGGILIEPFGTTVISNSTIRNNIAGIYGTGADGGGGIDNSGTLTIINSTIHGNKIIGGFDGSGIRNGGTLFLNNSTVTGNSWGGGGIHNDGTLFINNSTITRNRPTGINNRYGKVTFQNTLIAKNGSNGDCYNEPYYSGVITSQGYNLIGNGTGCSLIAVTGDMIGTSTDPINPNLSLLQDNGGLTFTHALMAGSPAIDAGNPASCLSTDQRGTIRPVESQCDIGAYEGSIPWAPSPFLDTYTGKDPTILQVDLPGVFVCDESDPLCLAGDYVAKAAHTHALGVFNLYAAQFNRNSLDNNGMPIVSSVHYCDHYIGCSYDNAFWNGSQIVYGDAHDFSLADDVVAHELTHGVTQYESNLFYFYQSGAINESLSDVWGEYYDQTNGLGNDSLAVKWLIGEDVTGMEPARSMSNPPTYGDPDKMTSPNYFKSYEDNGGVHTNSGVNNKAVFLMVDGGAFNSKTIAGIGWHKTAAIYYEANTNLLTSGSDYSDLYFALQQACVNLTGQYGITSGDCTQMKNALDAVQMNSQPAPGFNPDAATCAADLDALPIFQDDFESGFDNWNLSGSWYDSSGYASSGNKMLYGSDEIGFNNSSATMASGVLLPDSPNLSLRFKHAFAFEFDSHGNYYDGGVLEYSINDGATWVDAGSLFVDGQNYKGRISSYSGTANVLKGRSAFVGHSHGYVSSRYNLTSLKGKTVKFRWRFATDAEYYYLGWMLDDVQIYKCGSLVNPTVSSITRTGAELTNAKSVNYTVTFSKSVTGVDKKDFVVAATGGITKAAVSKVSGSGSTYIVTVGTGSGSGALGLNLIDNDSIKDAGLGALGGDGAGNGNFSGDTYTVEKTAPTVISITRLDASPTDLVSVNFTVTFSEPVMGVDINDFKLVGTGSLTKSKPVVTGVVGSGTVYTVTATTGTSTAPGTLRLDLMANKTIKDEALNLLTASYKTGEVYIVDRAPVVVSIIRSSPNPTKLAAVKFTLKFSESVTGVDVSDFTVIAPTLTLPSNPIVSITGSGTTWVVIVNTGTGSGTLRLDLIDNESIFDLTGNPLGGVGNINGDYTTGQVYNVR